MKVGTKILVICLFLAIIPTLMLGIVAYTSSSGVINEQIETLLETQVHDARGWTNDVYKLTRNKVNSDLNVLHENFYARGGTPEVIDGKLTLVDGGDSNPYVINDNFEIVDQVQSLVGGAATVFQVYDDNAVRISTNVIGNDGTRAVGTELTQNVYDVVVNQGETYYGSRDLFGKRYVTAYEPIKDSRGNIVGVLFVGTEEQETLDVVKSSLKETVIGRNGYMFVIDSAGQVLVHPSLEGENWAGEEFAKEMLQNKVGVIRHQIDGTDIIDAYTYYEPLDWYIVSRAELSDFTGPIDTIRNTIVVVVLASIAIGVAIAILFGRSISDPPLQQVVLMLKELRSGHLSARLNIRRQDEIGGVMARTMDEFAGDLQTNVVGNLKRSLSASTSRSSRSPTRATRYVPRSR